MEIKRVTVELDRQTNVSNYDFYFKSLGQSQSKFFAALRTNIIYRSFGVKLKKRRESVNLLVIVSSAPKRSDRRAGIRETWWTLCRNFMRERDRRLVCLNVCGLLICRPRQQRPVVTESRNVFIFSAFRGTCEQGNDSDIVTTDTSLFRDSFWGTGSRNEILL